MQFIPSRLRRGELLAGAGASVLLALMFLTKWERASDGRSLDGWHALTHLRWLILVTVLLALLLAFTQATLRAPAVPVSLSVLVTVLGLLTSLWLFYRVVLDPLPHQKIGAVLALLSACVTTYGGFRSMRQEGIAPRDAPRDIPTVRLGGP